MRALIKYRLHRSITAIKEKCISIFSFSFSQVKHDEVIKGTNNLKINKATQKIDIPTKFIVENHNIFEDFICENFNNSVFY